MAARFARAGCDMFLQDNLRESDLFKRALVIQDVVWLSNIDLLCSGME